MIFGEKIELKVYVNQHDFLSDIQTPIIFLIMSFTNIYWIAVSVLICSSKTPSMALQILEKFTYKGG